MNMVDPAGIIRSIALEFFNDKSWLVVHFVNFPFQKIATKRNSLEMKNLLIILKNLRSFSCSEFIELLWIFFLGNLEVESVTARELRRLKFRRILLAAHFKFSTWHQQFLETKTVIVRKKTCIAICTFLKEIMTKWNDLGFPDWDFFFFFS